jgi:hypothetical protein
MLISKYITGLIELLIHAPQVMHKNVNTNLTCRYITRIAHVYQEITSQIRSVNINQSVRTEKKFQKMSQNPQKSSNHVCWHIRNTTHKHNRRYVNCTKTNAASQHYCHVNSTGQSHYKQKYNDL